MFPTEILFYNFISHIYINMLLNYTKNKTTSSRFNELGCCIHNTKDSKKG